MLPLKVGGYSPRFLSTLHMARAPPKTRAPRIVPSKLCFEACKLLIVPSILFYSCVGTDDDILDTSIYRITFNCRFCIFAAQDGISTSHTMCKLWGRRNNAVCWLHQRARVLA